jgi:hypothetical protein
VVCRTLKKHGLYPYHVQQVQALLIVLFTNVAGFTHNGVFNGHNTHIQHHKSGMMQQILQGFETIYIQRAQTCTRNHGRHFLIVNTLLFSYGFGLTFTFTWFSLLVFFFAFPLSPNRPIRYLLQSAWFLIFSFVVRRGSGVISPATHAHPLSSPFSGRHNTNTTIHNIHGRPIRPGI